MSRSALSRGTSLQGGKRPYTNRLGKDRSPRHSGHFIASAKWPSAPSGSSHQHDGNTALRRKANSIRLERSYASEIPAVAAAREDLLAEREIVSYETGGSGGTGLATGRKARPQLQFDDLRGDALLSREQRSSSFGSGKS